MDVLKAIDAAMPKPLKEKTYTIQVTKQHKQALSKLHKETGIPTRVLAGIAVDSLVETLAKRKQKNDKTSD